MDIQAVTDVAELHLSEEAASVASSREFARQSLIRWGFRGQHADALLVVSELVTNALVHGRGAPVLRLSGTPDRLRVEVADDSPVLPTVRIHPGAVGGWGLRLIQRLGAAWGVSHHGRGKVVWCELAADADVVSASRPVA